MRYLAYGSNLHPGRLRERVPGAELRGATTIAGWQLRWHKRSHDGSAKCNIVSANIDSVVCVAIYDFDHSDLFLLDQAEGLGHGYEHHELEVDGFGACLTYLAQTTHIVDNLQPYQWYKEFVVLGCDYHGFDGCYVDAIRQLAHCDDPDRSRHRKNMAQIADLRTAK